MPFFLENILSNFGDFLFSFKNLAQSIPDLGILTILLTIFFAYRKTPAIFYVPLFALYFAQFDLGFNFWNSFILVSAIFTIPLLRKNLVTTLIVNLIEKLGLLPKISQTEKIALTSGGTWVDAQLFSGNPDFKWINSQKYPHLNDEERSFLKNEVEEVCKICSDYEVQTTRDLPPKVWQFLKDKKFFAMIIPKEFGGLGFSAYGHSCVVETLASRSVPLAITVMVPNSLGPAELLLHYGTKEQQEYYLPRLSDGREIPCFALTESGAGSDATSITSNGVLFKDENGDVKIRLNWRKRYITLGAVATLIGVAFKLSDPDKILSQKEEIGITCALIPASTKGVKQGRRHDPLATPFINSPLDGVDVIVGIDAVIGGQDGLGKGWKMLMECLAAGRGISLPSTSSGGSKMISRVVGAYASTRQQFGTSIAKFEGIEEVLARIASRTYAIDALRCFTAGAIDSGSKPAVITAIAKYHATEIFRQNINDGMDILGGRAIIRGPRNLLANAYFSTPISITVEGANIVTRSLIHFGQGAIMCHPYSYQEMQALENGDLAKFDKVFFSHVKHLLRNFTRSIISAITRGWLICPPSRNKLVATYQRKISWASATFAFFADLALARFGGNLKRKEKINGRFGDILSALYMAVCVLKKFEENGHKKEEEAIAEHALKELLAKAQNGFDGLYQNIFGILGSTILKPFAFFAKMNAFTCPPTDDSQRGVVKNLVKNSPFRDSLTKGVFISQGKDDNLGRLEHALKAHESIIDIVKKIKAAIKKGDLAKKRIEDLLDQAQEKSIISSAQKTKLQESLAIIKDAMEVDEYTLKEYNEI